MNTISVNGKIYGLKANIGTLKAISSFFKSNQVNYVWERLSKLKENEMTFDELLHFTYACLVEKPDFEDFQKEFYECESVNDIAIAVFSALTACYVVNVKQDSGEQDDQKKK